MEIDDYCCEEQACIGQPVKEFSVDIYDAKTKKQGKFTSEELQGKWTVLFFYPADFTFV